MRVLSGLHRRSLLTLAASAALTRCASTPDLTVLAADDGTLRRQILGSHSPLTQRQQTELLAQLSPAQREDALQRQSVLQQALSDAPMVSGNSVHLLRDGGEALPAMLQAIRAARDHVNLEFFIFQDVAWRGMQLSALLLDCLRRGVRVNIIYDAFGSSDTPAALFDTLRSAGGQVVEFNPLNPLAARAGWSPNDRDHRKILVVDGRIGFTGGINLDKVYENPPADGIPADGDAKHAHWRDSSVRIEGPAVAELQKVFFGTWKDQKGPPVRPAKYFPHLAPRGEQTVRIIGSSPGEQHPLYFLSLMTAVLSARQRVWLSTGYFVPPHEEREQFYKVARRGIDLRLVLPSHSDVQSAVYAARAAYGDLLRAGAHIYEVQTAVLHSKLATVDGVWSVVGSSNLDRRSVVFNNEVDAIILGRDTAAQVEATLRQDMAESHAITLSAWEDRSLGERFDELRARVWQYWM
jgi:cardiolipin synthase